MLLRILMILSAFAIGAMAATPKEEYAAIMRDYNADMGIRSAESDLERRRAVERFGRLAERLVRLAQKFPDDPIALTALRQAIQAINTTDSIAQVAWESNEGEFPRGSSDELVRATVDQLLRDHIRSKKLDRAIDRARYGYRPGFERFLREALRLNPDGANRAAGGLALAQYLLDKARLLQVAKDRPEVVDAYANIFGPNFLETWQERGIENLTAEAEQLFAKAVSHQDVEVRPGNVAAIATANLYDIRNLSVGQAAPETEGRDQEGVRFRLSDYRGKVVLLYFWMQFCPT
ncbi:MAG: redoxin domain-containing protein [Limisphaerales bacterium]